MAQLLSWLERQPVTLEVDGSSPFWVAIHALVAQSVEQQTENLPVGGSIPPQGTTERCTCRCSSMAEQLICNQQVVGSSPITGSNS